MRARAAGILTRMENITENIAESAPGDSMPGALDGTMANDLDSAAADDLNSGPRCVAPRFICAANALQQR